MSLDPTFRLKVSRTGIFWSGPKPCLVGKMLCRDDEFVCACVDRAVPRQRTRPLAIGERSFVAEGSPLPPVRASRAHYTTRALGQVVVKVWTHVSVFKCKKIVKNEVEKYYNIFYLYVINIFQL